MLYAHTERKKPFFISKELGEKFSNNENDDEKNGIKRYAAKENEIGCALWSRMNFHRFISTLFNANNN